MVVRSDQSARSHLGWDLNLHPDQLHIAYWRDKNSKYMQGDMQVAGFLLIVLTLSIIRNASVQTDPKPNVWASIPAWLVLAAWLLVASRRADAYCQHRTLFVLLFKTLLAAAVLHLTNDGGRLISWSNHESSSAVLLVKATSLHGLVHLPALCVGLPLPFWLQLGWVLGRMAIFWLGRATRELVSVSNTHGFLQDLSSFNSLWVRLVQSGSGAIVVSESSALHDHSAAMAVALLTMHLSAAALSMYLAYISQWVQLRAWLREQAAGADQHVQPQQQQQRHLDPQQPAQQQPQQPIQQQPQQQQPQPQQPQQQGPQQQQQSASACPRDVGGVLLTPRQLVDMGRSHAATLLLDGRGLLGRASMACFHACAVNLILLGVLLLSRLLVLRVGPRVLPGTLLRAYYPPRPELGGDVCWPEDEPRLSGFWGSLMFVLGL